MPEYTLTTPPFDCSEGVDVTLVFRRWLGVEQPAYDHARLQISNNNGSSWNNVWENSAQMDGARGKR